MYTSVYLPKRCIKCMRPVCIKSCYSILSFKEMHMVLIIGYIMIDILTITYLIAISRTVLFPEAKKRRQIYESLLNFHNLMTCNMSHFSLGVLNSIHVRYFSIPFHIEVSKWCHLFSSGRYWIGVSSSSISRIWDFILCKIAWKCACCSLMFWTKRVWVQINVSH